MKVELQYIPAKNIKWQVLIDGKVHPIRPSDYKDAMRLLEKGVAKEEVK